MEIEAFHFSVNGTQILEKDFDKERPPSYFLLIDELFAGQDDQAIQFVQQSIQKALPNKESASIQETQLVQALEAAHDALKLQYATQTPLFSVLLMLPRTSKSGVNTLLVATIGDMILYGSDKNGLKPVFSDPYTVPLAPHQSVEERLKGAYNYLGGKSTIHVACGRLDMQEEGQYVAASYGVYDSVRSDQLHTICLDPKNSQSGAASTFLTLPTEHQRSFLTLSYKPKSDPAQENAPYLASELKQMRKRNHVAATALTAATCGLIGLLGYHFLDNTPSNNPVFSQQMVSNASYLPKQEHEAVLQQIQYQHAKELQQLASEKEALMHKAATLEAAIENLKSTLQAKEGSDGTTNDLAYALQEAQKTINNHLEHQDSLVNKNTELLQAKEMLEKQLQELQKQLSQNEEGFKQKVVTLSHSLNILQTEHENLQSDFNHLNEKQKTLQETLHHWQETAKQAQKKAEMIQSTKNHLENEIKELSAQLIDSSASKDALKNQIAFLQQKESERELQVKQIQSQRDALFNELKQQLRQQQEALSSLKESRQGLTEQLSDFKGKQQQLQNQKPVKSNISSFSETRIHNVIAGDTLSTISENYYGTSKKWKDIYEANRDTIANPYQIKTGMQLVIP